MTARVDRQHKNEGILSCRGGHGFDDKSASKCIDDLDDGAETWVAFFVEAFVEAFAADSGFLGDLAHATRLGYVADGGLQKRRVAGFRGGVEVCDGVFFVFDVFAGIKIADIYHCLSLISDSGSDLRFGGMVVQSVQPLAELIGA